FALRKPSYRIASPGYGPLSADLRISPRVSPAIVGMGLLEAIPASALERLSDPDDRDRDGISGRVNVVWNQVADRTDVGRFGWKAEQPSVLLQTAAAFDGDIGITSRLFPSENHTSRQTAAAGQPHGSEPQAADKVLDAVVLYARTLAVPAARGEDDPQVRR